MKIICVRVILSALSR